MQFGFALSEAGNVRHKNINNAMIKNLIIGCIGLFVSWVAGYAFAFGHAERNSGLIWSEFFFGTDFDGTPKQYKYFCF